MPDFRVKESPAAISIVVKRPEGSVGLTGHSKTAFRGGSHGSFHPVNKRAAPPRKFEARERCGLITIRCPASVLECRPASEARGRKAKKLGGY